MTLNLVTACYLMTTLQTPFFNLLHDLVTLCNLVTVFAGTKSVTKSRLHLYTVLHIFWAGLAFGINVA